MDASAAGCHAQQVPFGSWRTLRTSSSYRTLTCKVNGEYKPLQESASSVSRRTVITTKVIAQHWGAGKVKTHLPYRDVVTIDSRWRPMYGTSTPIDREWFIRISRRVSRWFLIVHT